MGTVGVQADAQPLFYAKIVPRLGDRLGQAFALAAQSADRLGDVHSGRA